MLNKGLTRHRQDKRKAQVRASARRHASHNLNSLKGLYIGDYEEHYHKSYEGGY